MWGLTIILLVLEYFRSPALAGAAVLLGWLPGSLLSPIAGALLERHTKVPLILLDYGIAICTNSTIALLALTRTLREPSFLALVAIGSLTLPLSSAGLRTLLPRIMPASLWDQLNAIDSATANLAAVCGPALAGLCVAAFGARWTMLMTGAFLIGAAICILRVKEPPPMRTPSGWREVRREARQGLRYVFSHPVLRALISTEPIANVGLGMLQVALPVLILRGLHGTSRDVGFVWACFGFAAVLGALTSAHLPMLDREVRWMAITLIFAAGAYAGGLFANRLVFVFLGMTLAGAMTGFHDVALFSLRMRTIERSWLGRGITISMHLNSVGEPIGAAASGVFAQSHLQLVLWLIPSLYVSAGLITPRIFAASTRRALKHLDRLDRT
jgi:hypothetical protein